MEAGDRVILPDRGIDQPSKHHPYQGTEFACAGQITRVYIGSYSKQQMANVIWDNNVVTTLYTERLKFEDKKLKQTNPNQAFLLDKKRRKQWKKCFSL